MGNFCFGESKAAQNHRRSTRVESRGRVLTTCSLLVTENWKNLKINLKILVVTSNIMQNMNNEYEENKIRKQALVNLFRFVRKIL